MSSTILQKRRGESRGISSLKAALDKQNYSSLLWVTADGQVAPGGEVRGEVGHRAGGRGHHRLPEAVLDELEGEALAHIDEAEPVRGSVDEGWVMGVMGGA